MDFTPTLTLPLRGREFGGERNLVGDRLGLCEGPSQGGVVLRRLSHRGHDILLQEVAVGDELPGCGLDAVEEGLAGLVALLDGETRVAAGFALDSGGGEWYG